MENHVETIEIGVKKCPQINGKLFRNHPKTIAQIHGKLSLNSFCAIRERRQKWPQIRTNSLRNNPKTIVQIQKKVSLNSFCSQIAPRTGSGRAGRESLLVFDGPFRRKWRVWAPLSAPTDPAGDPRITFFIKNQHKMQKKQGTGRGREKT